MPFLAVRSTLSTSDDVAMYTSKNRVDQDSPLLAYHFRWEGPVRCSASLAWELPLRDETGQPVRFFGPDHEPSGYMQGGEFSPAGEFLYLVQEQQNGQWDAGINVFEMRTGKRVYRHKMDGGAPTYPSGLIGMYNEFEGVTYWDIDAEKRRPSDRAPEVSGHLHLIKLVNQNVRPLAPDDIYIRHYRIE